LTTTQPRLARDDRARWESRLLYLSSDAVEEACREVDPVACIAHALRCHAAGQAEVPDEAVLRWEPAGGGMARTLNMPGAIDGTPPILGTKIINSSTENPSRGLPRAAGLTLLFNPVTARPEVILQAATISALRTAAVSTLAAMHLCTKKAQLLGVAGSGPIARAHIQLMIEHLDIERILVYDVHPGRAEAFAEELKYLVRNVEIDLASGAEDLVCRSSLVVTATTTTVSYIRYDWLQRGSLIVNVSLDDVDTEAYLKVDRLYLDDWGLVVADSQRLLGQLVRSGHIAGPGQVCGRRVDGTLGELITGACGGRINDSEIILVNPFGMAIGDLAIANQVYEVALLRNYGVYLEG
jgi:N-[(2S)-2-amino-2-carboxyethyl]-L-glutamate dehydrogenase